MNDEVIKEQIKVSRDLVSQLRGFSNQEKVNDWLKMICDYQQWIIEQLYEKIIILEKSNMKD